MKGNNYNCYEAMTYKPNKHSIYAKKKNYRWKSFVNIDTKIPSDNWLTDSNPTVRK